MTARLRNGRTGPQEINAIGSLVACSRNGDCNFPQARMLALFDAANARQPVADIYAHKSDYTLNVLRRPFDAIALTRRAIELRPDVAQYRVNLAMQLTYVGRIEEAKSVVADLRAMGRLGQNDAAATMLEGRIAERIGKSVPAPSTTPAPPTT
jgi:protein O-mannosyl-transferase